MRIAASLSSTNVLRKSGTIIERLFVNKLFFPENIAHTWQQLKDSGVTGIEMYLHNKFTEKEVEQLRKLFLKHKMPVHSIHQPIRFFSQCKIEESEKIFQAAKTLDASLIVFHSDMAGDQLFDPAYVKNMKKLEKKYHIHACFENMQRNHIIWRNALFWHPKKYQKIMRDNNFSMTLDTTHMAQVGGDIVTFFKANKKHIRNIHLSDFKTHPFSASILGNFHMHMPLGKGELPIEKFLQTLKIEKYKGHITMEIETANLYALCESAYMIKKHTQ